VSHLFSVRPADAARRRALPALAVIAVLALGIFGAAAGPLGAQGPGLRGLRGESLAESDLSQGTTIIVVWASWSPKSRDIVARVNPLAQRWGGRARVITVNFQEDRKAVEGFLSGKGLSAPVFLDGDGAFSKKHAIATLPGLLILKDGQVAYRGKLPDDPDRVIGEILG
jgi:thiol-disulfide isomerase/thioredoxin